MYTTCPCENRFRFVKGGQMANAVGKRKEVVSVLRALVEQGRQLAHTRLLKYSVDANLDRSHWEEYKTLPQELAHGLTSYAAKMVSGQYKLAGIPHPVEVDSAQDSAVDPIAASPPYHWQQVDPLKLPGVNAGDATQAWVLRGVTARLPRTRVVLLTAGGFARCTCPHHEYWGLPCRHVLFLFGAPTLEMCDPLWWHSTVFGHPDDWLWNTYYRTQARTPGVLVRSTPASPLGGPSFTLMADVRALLVTDRYVMAEWQPNSTGGDAPDGTDGAAAAPSAVGTSGGSSEQSSKKGCALLKELAALVTGPFEEAYAEGKQAELIQASNEYLAAVQSLVQTQRVTTGFLTDGRPVSTAGAARNQHGRNTSRVNAPSYDPKRGTGNSRRRKRSDKSSHNECPDEGDAEGIAQPGSEDAPSRRSKKNKARTVPDAKRTQRQYGVPTTRAACQGGNGLSGGFGIAQGDFICWNGSLGR